MAEKSPGPLIRSRWFALVDLGLVILAGALWYNWPQLGWIPALLPLIPWLLRALNGAPPFRRTPLDIFLLFFMLTALMGVWAAYDRAAAWAKFWLLADGVFLYFALAGQPRQNRWLVAGGIGLFSAALAGYFFLTHDWQSEPAILDSLNRLGTAWMQLRPTLPTHVLHPNVAAGLLAMTAPFLPLLAWRGLRTQQPWLAAVAILGALLVGMALLMATSRGALLGLGSAALFWWLWKAVGALARRNGFARFRLFGIVLAVLALALVALVLLVPGQIVEMVNRMPGPANTGSRLELVRSLLFLIGDFPFTGGGLDAFPGLYSQYIRISPSHILAHGHNLFLDITLEQGLLGGLLLIAILGQGAWILLSEIRRRERRLGGTRQLLWAGLAGLVVVMVHGLVDDILYGSRAPLLLWVFPALGVSAAAGSGAPVRRKNTSWREVSLTPVAIALLLLGVYGYFFRGPLLAAWRSNLAAVQMARIELAFFPTDRWDDGAQADRLRPAAAAFDSGLQASPRNRTAHHRLGQIAMLFRDFEQAVDHLEAARRIAPSHPGIRKLLAYNYLWAGREADSLALLRSIPEAQAEMGIYVWWWRSLGREDLSERAAAMAAALPQNRR